MNFPILSFITFFPLVGVLLITTFKIDKEDLIKKTAIVVTAIDFIFSMVVIFGFDKNIAGFQFIENKAWMPSLGISYMMGVDGISILLVPLITGLTLISIIFSWDYIKDRVKEFYLFMLLMMIGMMGAILALDFFLFYIFWELMLIPMVFLIGIWGSENRLYAAIKFFLYTLLGSMLMLVGILALFLKHGELTGVYTFNVLELIKINQQYTSAFQFWIFILFFLAFAIKVPMFPFHTWLPDAHVQAPTAGSVILAGVMLKMGTYGFLRFSLPILPEASHRFAPLISILAFIAIVYCAWVAMGQKDMKRLIAYSSVCHMGAIMLGIFSFTQEGIEGGLMQIFNHGIVTGALFLSVGIIYERRHTKLIDEFGGLLKQTPHYGVLFTIFMLASVGVPFTNGFIGEIMILMGGFGNQLKNNSLFYRVLTMLSIPGFVFGAAYTFWMFQRVFLGEVTNPKNKKLKDLNLNELFCLVPLAIMVFWVGLYPVTFLNMFKASVTNLLKYL
ncbi:MAG: NADH-quinone oxidoreductase subunit M [Candidatus Firestonebacteria bacterium]|nr:NADH-quinone oxidoreductase subunit M [Candidatus Firestonebacteria bacterium]